MPRLFDFLQEADAELIRRSHRRRAKEIAASMSKGASTNKERQATTSSSRRMVQRTSAPRIRGREQGTSHKPVAERRQSTTMSSCYQRQSDSEDKTMAGDSATSPADGGNRTRSPSPCVYLDGFSSDDSVVDAPPQDLKVTLLYDSDDSGTPIVFSSDEPRSRPAQSMQTKQSALKPVGIAGPTSKPARIEKSST